MPAEALIGIGEDLHRPAESTRQPQDGEGRTAQAFQRLHRPGGALSVFDRARDQRGERRADERRTAEAEHALGDRVGNLDGAVLAQSDHGIGQRIQQGAGVIVALVLGGGHPVLQRVVAQLNPLQADGEA